MLNFSGFWGLMLIKIMLIKNSSVSLRHREYSAFFCGAAIELNRRQLCRGSFFSCFVLIELTWKDKFVKHVGGSRLLYLLSTKEEKILCVQALASFYWQLQIRQPIPMKMFLHLEKFRFIGLFLTFFSKEIQRSPARSAQNIEFFHYSGSDAIYRFQLL